MAAVGFLSAVTFYQDDLRVIVTLRTWNKSAVQQLVKQFIQQVQDGKVEKALALSDPASMEPLRDKQGEIIGIRNNEPSGFGRYKIYFKDLILPGEFRLKETKVTSTEGGSFTVLVAFSDQSEGWFVVKRLRNAYRITALPQIPGKSTF